MEKNKIMLAKPPTASPSSSSIFDSNTTDSGTAQATNTKSSSFGGNEGQYQYTYHGFDLTKESVPDMLAQNNSVRHGWSMLEAEKSSSTSIAIAVRRNIVADASDSQMYLSLGIKGCIYNEDEGLLEVDMCLLQMEEDELEDNGGCFPLLLESKDESLQQDVNMGGQISGKVAIVHMQGTAACNQDWNVQTIEFQKSALLQGSAKFSMNEEELLLTAAKAKYNRSSASNGASYLKLVKYLFRHEKTGAEMELRSPLTPILNSRGTIVTHDGNLSSPCIHISGSGSSSRGKGNSNSKANGNKKASFALDSDTSDDDGGQDEYEDDGFIVFGDVDSSEDEEDIPEKNEEANDDNDVCEICMDGGELLVCDGGVHKGGCGLSFHAECVEREEIPDGETCFLFL